MKIHTDEKENYVKRIDKMKEDIARRNKEIQKQNKEKEGLSRVRSGLNVLTFFVFYVIIIL